MKKIFPEDKVNLGVSKITPYQPGKSSNSLNIRKEKLIKLASNENPIGPSKLATKAISQIVEEAHRYPDGNGTKLKQEISKLEKVPFDCITLGNGSNDLIEFSARAFLTNGDNALYFKHGFAIYPLAIMATGADLRELPVTENYHQDLTSIIDYIDEKSKVVFIASPNNPTGSSNKISEIEAMLKDLPKDLIIFLDQAYFEYIEEEQYKISFNLIDKYENLIISRSFSKAHGLAAYRLGYSISSQKIADYLNRVRQPFNVSSFALEAGIASLNDNEHLRKSIDLNQKEKNKLIKFFNKENIQYLPSQGNFFSFSLGKDSDETFDDFLNEGIILRSLKSYNMDRFVRVSIGQEFENDSFIEATKKIKGSIN